MECTNIACGKQVPVDSFFCTWCGEYAGNATTGTKANLFARWVALTIDPLIGVVLWVVAALVFAPISEGMAWTMGILFPFAYTVWYLMKLREGKTPGKMLLGLQVVDQRNGAIPGFGRMFLREIVGRFLSGLLFGLGYLSAIFDKSGQAWHDKLAGTVVVKVAAPRPAALTRAQAAGR